MVLVLALPASLPHRDLLVTMTFGVVVLSILVQGTTMGPLLRRLGVVSRKAGQHDYERLRGASKAARAALAELDRASAEGGISREVADGLREEYRERIEEIEVGVKGMLSETAGLRQEEHATLRRRALVAEKDAVLQAFRSGELSEEAYDTLVTEVDAKLFELEENHDSS